MRPSIAFACLFLAITARAQQAAPGLPEPRLMTVLPAGARAGTEIGVLLGGVDLESATQLAFSHPGIRAEPIAIVGPPIDASNAAIQQRSRGLVGLATPSSWAAFRVIVPEDVPPGPVDVRIATPRGISNPRAFVISDQPQSIEQEPNDDVPQAQPIVWNSSVFGEISAPLDVDFYKFDGKKGQRVLAIGQSASIDSRLDLAIEIHDATGRMIASGHADRGRDVVIDATLPLDGEYTLRAHQFTYTRGGRDQFYRLNLTTSPRIEAVFPPMVEPGKSSTLTIWGRNLPGGQVDEAAVLDGIPLDRLEITVTPPEGAPLDLGSNPLPLMSSIDGFDIRLRNETGWSNPALISIAQEPLILDIGGNDRPESAQALAVPCEVAGRIESKGDRDWYAFDARKGEVLSIEAWGDRLGSPIDLYLLLRSADGKVLLEADENTELMHPVQLYTRTDDPPRYRFVAPADGRFLLRISSREAAAKADPRFQYRLRIAPERPDFRLVAMPWSPNSPSGTPLNSGGKLDYTVFAWRIDGFDGPIALSAEGLPAGVRAAPSSGIGQGQKQGMVVLEASDDAAEWTGLIRIRGTSRIDGKDVVREARTASISWVSQVLGNIPALSRLDRGLFLAVRPEKPAFAIEVEGGPYRGVQGTRLEIPIAIRRLRDDFKGPVQIASNGIQPPVASLSNLTANAGVERLKAFVTVASGALPGEHFISLQGQAAMPIPSQSAGPGANGTIRYPSNPVQLLILPRALAQFRLNPIMATAKLGGQAEVVVKVGRLLGYTGEFRVEMDPADGLQADPVVIEAGQDEARLIVKAAEDAKPGVRANLVVRATAMFRDDAPIVHEAKFTINLTK